MEEAHPFLSLLNPLLGVASVVDQSVDITMTVGLGFDFKAAWFLGKMGFAVDQSRDLFLLHEGDLVLGHAEVVVFFQELDGLGVSIIGSHDTEENLVFGS